MARDAAVTAPAPKPAAPQPTGSGGRFAGSPLATWDAVVIVGVVVVAVIAAALIDGFARGSNLGFLLLDSVPILLIALPMTLVIVTGEIDLSVASTLGLTSALMGQLWVSGVPLETIVVVCVLFGAMLGVVNAVFITGFGLPSLAVTIGTLALYRGLAFVVLGDRAVADFPISWTTAVTSSIPGTPIPGVMAAVLVLAAVFGVVLHATPVGRSLYAIGSNDEASRFAGIAVNRTKFWLFVVTGAVSSLAGVLWTLRYASARADNAIGLELTVIAAVLLGGISIFGGKGALPGVVGAVLLLGTLRNALQLANVSADALTVVTGGLLIVSVVAPNLVALARRGLRRRRPRKAHS